MLLFRHTLSSLSWPRLARPSSHSFTLLLSESSIHSLPCFWSPNSMWSSARPQLCFRPASFPSPASTLVSLIQNRLLVSQLRLTLRPSVLRGTGPSLPWPRALCRRRDCPLQARQRPEPSSLRLQDPGEHSTCNCSFGGQDLPPGATPTCLHPLP